MADSNLPLCKKATESNPSSANQSVAIQGETKEVVVFGAGVMQARDVKVELHLTQNMPGYKKPEPVAKLMFQVQDPIDTFTGRKEFLKNLHEIIQQSKNKERKITILSQTSSVTGLGGIGKSETVRMYIQEYVDEYDNVVWIDAENSSDATAQFLILAGQELNISTKDGENKPIKFTYIRDKVYEKLCQKPKRLLIIFDNAEDLDSTDGIRQFLPAHTRVIEPPIVLLTSRQQKWEGANTVTLGLWEIEECVEYIYMRLKLEDTPEHEEDAKKLAALFDRLPIAIQLAVSTIVEISEEKQVCGNGDYGINDLIAEYDEIDNDSKEKRQVTSIQTPIQKLLNVSLQKIEKNQQGKIALKILAFMAYLSPNKIPTVIIRWLLEKENEQDELGRALLLLTKYSIVQSFGTYLTIHRVFQDVIVTSLHNANIQEPINTDINITFPLHKDEMTILGVLSSTFLPHIAKEERIEDYKNDVIANIIHTTEYMVKASMITEFYDYLDAVAAFIELTQHEVAIKLYMKLIECDIKTQSQPQPEATLKKISAIAGIYFHNGEYGDALETYNTLLHGGRIPKQDKFKCNFVIEKGQVNVLGARHQTTLRMKHNIASCLGENGEKEEALMLYEVILEAQEEELGELHPDTLLTKNCIAKILGEQGKAKEALKLYMDVLGAQTTMLGDLHPNTLLTKNNIADHLTEYGNYEEAMKLYHVLLETREKELGALHPLTLRTKTNTAYCLYKQGKNEEALVIYDVVLKAQEELVGDLHPDTLLTKHNIANCLSAQGKKDEALKLSYVVLEGREKVLSAFHPDTLNTKHNIANRLTEQGKYEDALMLYQAVLEAQEQLHGDIHPEVLLTKLNMAICIRSQEKYDEGLKLFQELLEIQEERLGSFHPRNLVIKHYIADCLNNQGKTEEALELFHIVLEAEEKVLGAHHPYTLMTKHAISLCRGEEDEN